MIIADKLYIWNGNIFFELCGDIVEGTVKGDVKGDRLCFPEDGNIDFECLGVDELELSLIWEDGAKLRESEAIEPGQ